MKLLKAILLLSLSLSAKPIYDFKPIEVSKGVVCAIGDFNPPNKKNKGFVNNTCYIDTGDFLVIIDPGPSYKFAEEFADLATKATHKKIKYAIVTNYHDDRLYGASYYISKNIAVVAHKSIIDDIKNNPNKFKRLPRLLTKDEFEETKLVTPNILFDDKYVIKGSKRVVEAIKLTPVSEEHSDIIVWVPQDKFLFAGNIIFNNRALNYTKNSNIDSWIEAIEKIKEMKPKVIVGGHGAIIGKDAYKTTLEYLKSLKKQVKKAYDSDVDLSELDKHIDLSKFDNLEHAKELKIHNANNYYNQLDWEEE